MKPLLYSALVGALAEIGDRSQFMLFVLSFRFRDAAVAVVGGMVAAMIIMTMRLRRRNPAHDRGARSVAAGVFMS